MSAAKRKRTAHERARVSARRARTAASVRALGPLGLRLRANRSVLMIVDVQEKLAPAVHETDRVVANCAILMRAATRLAVPLVVTEHCTERLGPTVPALAPLTTRSGMLSKVHFCAADEPVVAQRLASLGRPQVVIAGMEAHVCVLQTALGFAERGYRPHVVADAVGSRRALSCTVALERLRAAGVTVVTTEMVVFEWLDHADRPELTELLALIK